MSKMSRAPACAQVRIAQSAIGDVAVCQDCGVVHLSLEHMSLRLNLEDFKCLAQMLSAAQGEIGLWERMARSERERLDVHVPDESSSLVH